MCVALRVSTRDSQHLEEELYVLISCCDGNGIDFLYRSNGGRALPSAYKLRLDIYSRTRALDLRESWLEIVHLDSAANRINILDPCYENMRI